MASSFNIEALILGIFLLVGGILTAIGVIFIIPLIPEFTFDKLVSSGKYLASLLGFGILIALGLAFIIVSIYAAQKIKK